MPTDPSLDGSLTKFVAFECRFKSARRFPSRLCIVFRRDCPKLIALLFISKVETDVSWLVVCLIVQHDHCPASWPALWCSSDPMTTQSRGTF